MNVIVINPPLVQLNTAYPSGAYLKAFFKSQNCNTQSYDLSIQLFYSIFSKQGLTKLFELSWAKANKIANQAEERGDETTAFNIRRYLNNKNNWINWIDFITDTLRGGGREKAHQFLFSPYAPRGSRMDNFLSNLQREPNIDDVRFLCSFALADLADYITAVFDPHFSLIRYAEALTVDESSFSEIEKNVDSPVMKEFYYPVLKKNFSDFDFHSDVDDEKTLICISVPFAGTFTPALFTAKYFKEKFKDKVFVVIGGGFVNTELRQANEVALAKYIDGISYDRGYGSYIEFLNLYNSKKLDSKASLYKLRRFIKSVDNSVNVIDPLWKKNEVQLLEDKITVSLIPDYSDVDFSIYPRLCDDLNPMHRLWVDGAWVKAYLAHGCYWHKCAFCDTNLDYVCAYKVTDIEPLFYGLLKTCNEKQVYGIHFVDEALPPAALKKFALLNAQNGNLLYYWGNIRFEKSFTYDLAAFLSYCGFGGASAGIEAATNNGLQSINKGTDIHNIVNAACAFKENGILVHAYMIYGFWNDTPQGIIDSLETLRQLFAAGLLDSAFWHKFVLTKNSTVYTEWEKGGHPELKPIVNKQESMFAKNDLHFEGEQKYNKFGNGLDRAVDAWMHGQKLEMNIKKWFDFNVPEPTIGKNYIENEISKYEKAKENKGRNIQFTENLFWLGGTPVVHGQIITWFFMQEEMAVEMNSKNEANDLAEILNELKPEADLSKKNDVLKRIKSDKNIQNIIKKLHGSGIVEV